MSLASPVDSLEHLHWTEFGKEPLLIVKPELNKLFLFFDELFFVLYQSQKEFTEQKFGIAKEGCISTEFTLADCVVYFTGAFF